MKHRSRFLPSYISEIKLTISTEGQLKDVIEFPPTIGVIITDLEVRKISLKGDKLKDLLDAIKATAILSTVILDGCEIDNQGFRSIANYFRYSTSLNNLIVTDNKIEKDGANYIANFIRKNKSLLHVDLSNNNMNRKAHFNISRAFCKNHNIISFEFDNNLPKDLSNSISSVCIRNYKEGEKLATKVCNQDTPIKNLDSRKELVINLLTTKFESFSEARKVLDKHTHSKYELNNLIDIMERRLPLNGTGFMFFAEHKNEATEKLNIKFRRANSKVEEILNTYEKQFKENWFNIIGITSNPFWIIMNQDKSTRFVVPYDILEKIGSHFMRNLQSNDRQVSR